MLSNIVITLFLAGLIFAAVNDVRTMTIPNWLSAAYVVSFPVIALINGASLELIGWHFVCGLIALVVCFGLFTVNVFGGGDAKLIPAVLLWLGPQAVMSFTMGMAIAGGLLAGSYLASRRFIPAENVPGFLQRSVVEGPGVPYAVAIAVGGVMAIKASPFFLSLISSSNFSALTMP
ncbi:MAG: hypothetical protein CMK07_02760 [Ponticaulis sp.]|nr:hypothetical protein [Ponticaulis sp.]